MNKYVIMYIDDFAIIRQDRDSEYRDLQAVVWRIQENESYSSAKKCDLFKDKWLPWHALRQELYKGDFEEVKDIGFMT